MSDSKEVHHLYHNSPKSPFSSLVAGVAAGFVAGVALGLLKAPKKGTELQKDLKKKLNKTVGKISQVKQDVSPKLQEAFGHISEEIGGLYQDVKKDIVQAAEGSKETLSKEKFDAIVDKVVEGHKTRKKKYSEKLEKIGTEFKSSWDELKDVLVKK